MLVLQYCVFSTFLIFFTFFLFFFNDTATTEIYTLSLHDVFRSRCCRCAGCRRGSATRRCWTASTSTSGARSEEHTSELQSHSDLVCRLLLEKKKKKTSTSKAYKCDS